jgi:hypothetical protein
MNVAGEKGVPVPACQKRATLEDSLSEANIIFKKFAVKRKGLSEANIWLIKFIPKFLE